MISDILSLGTTVIDKIWQDAGEAKEAKRKLMELYQQGELKQMQSQMNMIVAEAKSKDKWTSRARPSFLYVMYTMILTSIPMGILHAFDPSLAANIQTGVANWLGSIPKAMWGLFGAGYLGYVGGRSYDKKKLIEQAEKLGQGTLQ